MLQILAFALAHLSRRNPTMLTVLLVLAFLLATVLWKRTARSALPLPPGPKPLPLIGNMFDMPTKRIGPALRELGNKYGTSRPNRDFIQLI